MIHAEASALIDERALAYARAVVRRRYRSEAIIRGLTLEDIEAAGIAGLWRAALEFDPARGVPFLAYSAWRVKEYARSFVSAWAHRTRARSVEEDWHRDVPTAADSPWRSAAAKEELRASFDAMTNMQRACVVARHVEGQDIQEIADRFGVKRNTVYSHLSERSIA